MVWLTDVLLWLFWKRGCFWVAPRSLKLLWVRFLCSRSFARAVEEWRQFHHDLDDLTQWLSEAEDLLVDTCAPDGSLDLEKARTHQLVSVSHPRSSVCKKVGCLFRCGCWDVSQKVEPILLIFFIYMYIYHCNFYHCTFFLTSSFQFWNSKKHWSSYKL